MNLTHSFSGVILALHQQCLHTGTADTGQPQTQLPVNPKCRTQKVLNTVSWLLACILYCLSMDANSAMALQVHGSPEGLYVHQMAHLHYLIALVFFLWYIRRAAFTGRGWRYLQWFCLIMGAWNILTFAGHCAATGVEAESLAQSSHYLTTRLLPPFTTNNLLFYLAKLDHLFCAPALFCLFMAVRSFYCSAVTEYGDSR